MRVVIDNFINEWNSLPGFSILEISVCNTGYLIDMRLIVLGIGVDIVIYYRKFVGT